MAGIAAAVCYGTNPLGALKLYATGMQTNSVLFYRFGLAWVIIAIVMLFRKEHLKVTRQEFRVLTGLGLLFIVSSLTLYLSFHYMAAGVASTILFTYPVMTAVIMALFFHERVTFATLLSLLLSGVGVVLLYWSDNGEALSTIGVLLVLASALSYALYIILMNKGNLQMSSIKINFYVLLYCALGILCFGNGGLFFGCGVAAHAASGSRQLVLCGLARFGARHLRIGADGVCRQIRRLHRHRHSGRARTAHRRAHRPARVQRTVHDLPGHRYRAHSRSGGDHCHGATEKTGRRPDISAKPCRSLRTCLIIW